MKIVALIPARSGSKRVPNKNIRILGEHPLLAWSILTAKECDLTPYLSTDSEEYAEIGRSYGSEVIMRSPELASDQAQDREILLHAYEPMGKPEMIAYLRPTTPFRTVELVKHAIRWVEINLPSEATGLRSVEEMSESAYKCFTIKGFLEPIWCEGKNVTETPNQWVPKTYRPNGYVDICLTKTILAGGSAWGANIIPFLTPRTVEIDTEEDFKYAEYLSKRRIYA